MVERITEGNTPVLRAFLMALDFCVCYRLEMQKIGETDVSEQEQCCVALKGHLPNGFPFDNIEDDEYVIVSCVLFKNNIELDHDA